MTVKTDRKDARGLAQLIRMGWFRPVHAKSCLYPVTTGHNPRATAILSQANPGTRAAG
jgi:hypothetical protein